jgi:hypothetical protein
VVNEANTNNTLDGWHIWTMEWNATAMAFFRDGLFLGALRNPAFLALYTAPQYLIFGLAVMDGEEAPVADTSFPYTVQVDWVRVAQYQAETGPPQAT